MRFELNRTAVSGFGYNIVIFSLVLKLEQCQGPLVKYIPELELSSS